MNGGVRSRGGTSAAGRRLADTRKAAVPALTRRRAMALLSQCRLAATRGGHGPAVYSTGGGADAVAATCDSVVVAAPRGWRRAAVLMRRQRGLAATCGCSRPRGRAARRAGDDIRRSSGGGWRTVAGERKCLYSDSRSNAVNITLKTAAESSSSTEASQNLVSDVAKSMSSGGSMQRT